MMWSRDIYLMVASCLFVAIVLSLLMLGSRAAYPQQAIIYGADGKRIGTTTIDSQGTATTRGADGRVVTRETLTDRDRRHPHTLKPGAK